MLLEEIRSGVTIRWASFKVFVFVFPWTSTFFLCELQENCLTFLNYSTVLYLVACVWHFVTPWTAAHQALLFMRFSRQGYWSGLPFPSPGDLPDPGIKPGSPAQQADSLPTELRGKPYGLNGLYSTKSFILYFLPCFFLSSFHPPFLSFFYF